MTSVTRPSWSDYFLGVAKAVAARADCTRRQVGCVIVDADHRVIATGYNGSEPGGPSCLAGQCPRGRHYQRESCGWHINLSPEEAQAYGCTPPCACGREWPCPDAVTPGSSYDSGKGACISTHAEANALLFARASVKGYTLYCTDEPCDGCTRLIASAGIKEVITDARE